jgi:hypothetical protein
MPTDRDAKRMTSEAMPRLADTIPPSPPADVVATSELFRLRRRVVVDSAGFIGFVSCFAIAGIVGFNKLSIDVLFEADWAMFRYIGGMFAAGLAGGLVCMGLGHLLASLMERLDLKWRPRRYERDGIKQ